MLSEVGFNRRLVGVQLALWALKWNHSEGLNSSARVLSQVGTKGVFRDANTAADVLMREVERLQPQRPHFLLNSWMRMAHSLVLQLFNGFRLERDAQHDLSLISHSGACQKIRKRSPFSVYIDHWLRVLKADKRAIFSVASAAQKAADYLLERAGVGELVATDREQAA